MAKAFRIDLAGGKAAGFAIRENFHQAAIGNGFADWFNTFAWLGPASPATQASILLAIKPNQYSARVHGWTQPRRKHPEQRVDVTARVINGSEFKERGK